MTGEQMMSDERLAEIRERADRATREELTRTKNRDYETYGPFAYRIREDYDGSGTIGGADELGDADLWAHANRDIPDLLCCIEAQRVEIERLKSERRDWHSTVGMFDDDPGFEGIIAEGQRIRQAERDEEAHNDRA